MTQYSEESEKALERYLIEEAKARGFMALKYYNQNATGWPDRLVVKPGGSVFWVELKSRGKNLSPLQAHRRAVLTEKMHHRVYVCDSREKIDQSLDYEIQGA